MIPLHADRKFPTGAVRVPSVTSLSEAQQLADEAAKVLGYRRYKTHVTGTDAETNQTKLDLALQRLNICAMSPAAVKKYKAEKLAAARDDFGKRPYRHLVFCNYLWYAATLVLSLGLPFLVFRSTWISTAACFSLFIVTAVMALRSSKAIDEADSWEWRIVPLDRYDKPVPEFVLRKAIQIKTLFPEVRLFVDELSKKGTSDDPFLVAYHEGNERHIEVWEEPRFEFRV